MVLRAMALDPNDRFQSAKDLERELVACRAALSATPPSIVSQAPRNCARCGCVSPIEARFCMRCGQALWDEPWQTAPVPAIPARPGAASAIGAAAAARPMAPYPARPAAQAALPAALTRPTQPPAVGWPAARSPRRPAARVGWGARGEIGGQVGAHAAAFAAGPALWRNPAAWLTPLDQAPPATPQEAPVCLAAFLAVVCVALSLTAPFSPAMTAFTAPGLALGAWSLARIGKTSAPREFRWLAIVALTLGGLWLLALILRFVLTLR
jgi:hypothetical protein